MHRRILPLLALFVGLTGSFRTAHADSQVTLEPPPGPGGFALLNPVSVHMKLTPESPAVGDDVTLTVTATITRPYHIYAIDQGSDGIGLATTVTTVPVGMQSTKSLTASTPAEIEHPLEGVTNRVHYDEAVWTETFQVTASDVSLSGQVGYQACDDRGCQQPVSIPYKLTLTAAPAPAADENSRESEPAETDAATAVSLRPEVGFGAIREPGPVELKINLTPAQPAVGSRVTVAVEAQIDGDYHIYALDQDPVTGIGEPTVIKLSRIEGLEPVGTEFGVVPEPEIEHPLPDVTNRVHYGTVSWTRQFVVTDSQIDIGGSIAFSACNDGGCLPPANGDFQLTTAASETRGMADTIPDRAIEPTADPAESATTESPSTAVAESETTDASEPVAGKADLLDQGILPFLLTCVVGGYLSLLTPCVFPMIPVTVSFFLKQGEKDNKSPVGLAVIYCLGIIGSFTILGVLVAAVYGPAQLNNLANNGWLNIVLAIIFLAFGLMLLGMFEIRIPSGLLTWTSKRQGSGGVIGALAMALTFTLVSFTCTFAVVGSLLILAAKGSFFWPVIGMLAFSSAFASPFFLLALFPSLLKSLPKSGGWMNTVKVTLGLVELAFVGKFLSVADIAFNPLGVPRFLDFELMMCLWIALSIVTGLYLLGLFRTAHDTPDTPISAVRCLIGVGFFTFAGYLGVGMMASREPTGFTWEQVVAFAPPRLEVGGEGGGADGGHGGFPQEPAVFDQSTPTIWHHGLQYALQFEAATDVAAEAGKPLFIDFTGVNCVNCRKMEQTVLSKAVVRNAMKDLVRVQLYTDIVPGVEDADLRTQILTDNRELQTEWLRDATLPAYAVVSPDGKTILSTLLGYDPSTERFTKFLEEGVTKWQQMAAADKAAAATPVVAPAGSHGNAM